MLTMPFACLKSSNP